MNVFTRVVDNNGNTVKCYKCEMPATHYMNAAIAVASTVPIQWTPACDDHGDTRFVNLFYSVYHRP